MGCLWCRDCGYGEVAVVRYVRGVIHIWSVGIITSCVRTFARDKGRVGWRCGGGLNME